MWKICCHTLPLLYKSVCVCERRQCGLHLTGSLSQSFYPSHRSKAVITTATLLAAFVESNKIWEDSSEI